MLGFVIRAAELIAGLYPLLIVPRYVRIRIRITAYLIIFPGDYLNIISCNYQVLVEGSVCLDQPLMRII